MAKLVSIYNNTNNNNSNSTTTTTTSTNKNAIACQLSSSSSSQSSTSSTTTQQQLLERQIPITIDDQLTMIMQIDDLPCFGCEKEMIKKRDYDQYLRRYPKLFINNKNYLYKHLFIKPNDLINSLQQLIPCIGCKTSVERFYKQLLTNNKTTPTTIPSISCDNNNNNDILSIALAPLIIDSQGYLTIKRSLIEPKSLYHLFYVHGTKLDSLIESIPKNKKNRRCFIHSLDTHKTKNLDDWIEVWQSMSNECCNQLLIINKSNLMQTLDNYLRKHRFCSDCKNKVMCAFNILIGESDSSKEKGYNATLFDGIKYCSKHIHLTCDRLFVSQLIQRAESEIQGNRRERHAKTIEVAQEEVLTCIGIYLYEKFHRIRHSMRSEEQTWQLLFYIGVYTLKKCFEFEIEKVNGNNDIDFDDDCNKENRKLNKKQKKIKLNNNNNNNNNGMIATNSNTSQNKKSNNNNNNSKLSNTGSSSSISDNHNHNTNSCNNNNKMNTKSNGNGYLLFNGGEEEEEVEEDDVEEEDIDEREDDDEVIDSDEEEEDDDDEDEEEEEVDDDDDDHDECSDVESKCNCETTTMTTTQIIHTVNTKNNNKTNNNNNSNITISKSNSNGKMNSIAINCDKNNNNITTKTTTTTTATIKTNMNGNGCVSSKNSCNGIVNSSSNISNNNAKSSVCSSSNSSRSSNEMLDICLNGHNNNNNNRPKLLSDNNNNNNNTNNTSNSTNNRNLNDISKIDAGYSSGHESNASSELCYTTEHLVCNIEQCKCHQDTMDIIGCNELIITQPQICGCDTMNVNYNGTTSNGTNTTNNNNNNRSNSNCLNVNFNCSFDIIGYSRLIEQSTQNEDTIMDKTNKITDEEKNEYYANKTLYLNERTAHRMQLKEKFQNIQFKIKPRNA